MTKSIVQDKSYQFALSVIKTYKNLHQQKEFVLGNQFLRSGTSIGANIHEALGGYTKKDFTAKMSIAHKEALETRYWIMLMRDSSILESVESETLLNFCNELIKILVSIIKTSRNSL